MKRMNITLSDELAELLEDKPNKGRFIAEAVRDKVEREGKNKLRKKLIEGYKKEKKEGRLVNEEWESGSTPILLRLYR